MRLGILKKRFIIRLIERVVSLYLFVVFRTCKKNFYISDKFADGLTVDAPSFLYFWHGRITICAYFLLNFANELKAQTSSVISASMDGDIIAGIVKRFGHSTIRGSSRKNKLAAIKGIVQALKNKNTVGIAIDGPKGPKFKVKKASLKLAVRYKVPIFCVSFSASRALVLNSWDQMVLPIPFISELFIEVLDPIQLTSNNEENGLYLEEAMFNQMQRLDTLAKLKVYY